MQHFAYTANEGFGIRINMDFSFHETHTANFIFSAKNSQDYDN